MERSPIRASLVDEFRTDSRRGLCIGEVSALEIAERFGTPAYVYDARILQRNLVKVRAALGPRVEVLFALKANPSAAVAQVLRRAGAGCEVASAGEIQVAARAGFRGSQIQFAGPGKTALDIASALEMGIDALNVESEGEYELVLAHAPRCQERPRIAIRVNPATSPFGPRLRMSGPSTRFGVDEADVPGLLRRIARDAVCDLRGLHAYAGTQCFDAGAWLQNADHLCDLANRLELELDLALPCLNFGGGLGVSLFAHDSVLDLGNLGAGLRELLERDARPDRRYAVELGRYLAASAGVYLTRVLYAKKSAGRQHLILDGGMHHHAAAAGLGSVIRRPFPIVLARAPHAEPTERYAAGGPLCTPADEFAADIALPTVHPGDLIAVLGSGAYGLTFSPALFLGHPLPCEVLVDDECATIVRERGIPMDALRGQHLPDERGARTLLEPREARDDETT
jgi:diaminopimelate decarboxylase